MADIRPFIRPVERDSPSLKGLETLVEELRPKVLGLPYKNTAHKAFGDSPDYNNIKFHALQRMLRLAHGAEPVEPAHNGPQQDQGHGSMPDKLRAFLVGIFMECNDYERATLPPEDIEDPGYVSMLCAAYITAQRISFAENWLSIERRWRHSEPLERAKSLRSQIFRLPAEHIFINNVFSGTRNVAQVSELIALGDRMVKMGETLQAEMSARALELRPVSILALPFARAASPVTSDVRLPKQTEDAIAACKAYIDQANALLDTLEFDDPSHRTYFAKVVDDYGWGKKRLNALSNRMEKYDYDDPAEIAMCWGAFVCMQRLIRLEKNIFRLTHGTNGADLDPGSFRLAGEHVYLDNAAMTTPRQSTVLRDAMVLSEKGIKTLSALIPAEKRAAHKPNLEPVMVLF